VPLQQKENQQDRVPDDLNHITNYTKILCIRNIRSNYIASKQSINLQILKNKGTIILYVVSSFVMRNVKKKPLVES